MRERTEPQGRGERALTARSTTLAALLDALRETGVLAEPAYAWDPQRPWEPSLLAAGVRIWCDDQGDEPLYMIGQHRPTAVPATNVDDAVREIRSAARRPLPRKA